MFGAASIYSVQPEGGLAVVRVGSSMDNLNWRGRGDASASLMHLKMKV